MIITGKDLKRIGLPQGKAVSYAKEIADSLFQENQAKNEILMQLQSIIENPQPYLEKPLYQNLAQLLMPEPVAAVDTLLENPKPYKIFGKALISKETQEQIRVAMRLPVSVAGALMPDAHVGYGLPIGGVLATKNTVIPYAVGVDIACRMMLSIFPEPPNLYDSQFDRLKKALENETHFGIGNIWKAHDGRRPFHAILDAPLWNEIPMLSSLKSKAQAQIGTSGSGNHFVEWGIFTLKQDDLGLKAGKYIALLSS